MTACSQRAECMEKQGTGTLALLFISGNAPYMGENVAMEGSWIERQ